MDRKPKDGSRFAPSLPFAFGNMVFRHRDIQAGGDLGGGPLVWNFNCYRGSECV
jgi:hypothetical protein